ncbi:hypothetical protein Ahy_B10g106095 isoform B [Arachis hypogaea]|uniref:L-2-hydroxyglutarate dehydrogenase, mitochondrial n=1 Tax=Arachis hypogaea TaxID=3818 RepID=A0A444X9R1_ARAHY|nr:hypothetical protein Ahy_B10g106095 isoform B [Arachis hypogaea]
MLVQGEAESHRTTFTYNSAVIGGHLEGNQICVHVSETNSLKEWNGTSTALNPDLVLVPNLVVNSAGLSAPALAKRFTGLASEVIPSAYYARGCYFTLSNTKTTPFQHLIYPIPEDGGLGVHVTLDLNGQVKFGPDVEWIDSIDDISRIRPKLSGPGQPPVDFVIQGENIHGIPGLVNLFGIESPGLTSSLAIAEYIVTRFLG